MKLLNSLLYKSQEQDKQLIGWSPTALAAASSNRTENIRILENFWGT